MRRAFHKATKDTPPEATAVLSYWFGQRPVTTVGPDLVTRWFNGGPAVDNEIRQQFGPLVQAAVCPPSSTNNDSLASWENTPDGLCAKVIIFDQFTRNMFRGSADAFAGDAEALRLAETALSNGWLFTPEYGFVETMFTLLPFEHSESVEVQQRSVQLNDRLLEWVEEERDTLTDSVVQCAKGFYDAAAGHRKVVLEFGRYPHRNAVLGRPSTPAELEFLKTADRYGQ